MIQRTANALLAAAIVVAFANAWLLLSYRMLGFR